MSLAPTLYDFEVEYSDADRGLTTSLRLRTARHPSEALERVWLRVLAYCWKYEERLVFGPGLSDTEAPDLLATDLTGQVTRWIRVGKSSAEKLQRAVDRNPGASVSVLFESPARMEQLLAEAREGELSRLGQVELAAVDPSLLAALAEEDVRRRKVQITLAGEHFYVTLGDRTLDAELVSGRVGLH